MTKMTLLVKSLGGWRCEGGLGETWRACCGAGHSKSRKGQRLKDVETQILINLWVVELVEFWGPFLEPFVRIINFHPFLG